MSKKKSKKPTFGVTSSNPFEKFDSKKKTKALNLETPSKNRSRFIKKFKDSDLVHDHSSKKSRKLQLYNLTDEFTLTHKNKPLDENYESDLDLSSDEDVDLKGDYSNISETYKEYKNLREQSRRDKEQQKDLLSKLDEEFEHLDFSQFYKPPKNSAEGLKSQTAGEKLDRYESNLRDLQLNQERTVSSFDLAKEYNSAANISQRCAVVAKILKSDCNFQNFCENYLQGFFDSFSTYLDQDDLTNCVNYLDVFCKGFLHLSNKNHKEYKSHLENQLLKVNSSLQLTGSSALAHPQKLQDQVQNLQNYLLLYLVLKTTQLNDNLNKFALLLLETYLADLHKQLSDPSLAHSFHSPEDPQHNRNPLDTKRVLFCLKLLLLTSYNSLLEGGYYMPYFFHVSSKLLAFDDLELSLLTLKLLKVALNLLLYNNSDVTNVLHTVEPSLKHLKARLDSFASATTSTTDSLKTPTLNSHGKEELVKRLSEAYSDFETYLSTLSSLKPRPKSLDIYNAHSLKTEHYKLPDKSSTRKHSREKSEKLEYNNLKRLLLTESLRKTQESREKRSKQRLETESRYKKVLRDAFVEQETLRKLSTSSYTRRYPKKSKGKR